LVTTEKQIETLILSWLNFQPDCFAFKINTVGVFDPVHKVFRKNRNRFLIKGTSDIMAIYKGQFIAVEVKSKKGRLSLDQMSFLEKVSLAGGYFCVVRSLEEAKTFFSGIFTPSISQVKQNPSDRHSNHPEAKDLPGMPSIKNQDLLPD
jgi:penicillin-binding protein-related factor A (putative recombinase)